MQMPRDEFLYTRPGLSGSTSDPGASSSTAGLLLVVAAGEMSIQVDDAAPDALSTIL